MSLNEKIIVPVFHELVKHKPKLVMLLSEEDEEETDVRRLANEITPVIIRELRVFRRCPRRR